MNILIYTIRNDNYFIWDSSESIFDSVDCESDESIPMKYKGAYLGLQVPVNNGTPLLHLMKG